MLHGRELYGLRGLEELLLHVRHEQEEPAGERGLVLAIFARAGHAIHVSPGATAELELHDPLRQKTLEVRGQQVPLEAQTTTAFAYLLGRSRVWQFEIAGFMGRETEVPTGLAMVEPWTRGKIPVVFYRGPEADDSRRLLPGARG